MRRTVSSLNQRCKQRCLHSVASGCGFFDTFQIGASDHETDVSCQGICFGLSIRFDLVAI